MPKPGRHDDEVARPVASLDDRGHCVGTPTTPFVATLRPADARGEVTLCSRPPHPHLGSRSPARLTLRTHGPGVMTRLRERIMGLFAGLFVATAVLAALELTGLRQAPGSLEPVARRIGPAFLFLLLLVLVKFGPTAWRELKYWATRPFMFGDALLVTVFAALVTARWWRSAVLGVFGATWTLPTTLLGSLAGVAELARWARWGWDRLGDPPASPPPTATGELLDKVVGPDGLEPLPDLDTDDTLD